MKYEGSALETYKMDEIMFGIFFVKFAFSTKLKIR